MQEQNDFDREGATAEEKVRAQIPADTLVKIAHYRQLGKHHNQKGHKYPKWLRNRRPKFKGTGWRY